MTIKEIRKAYTAWEASREEAAEKVRSLSREWDEIRKMKLEAIEAEDAKRYIDLKQRETDLEPALAIQRNKAHKSFSIPAEDLTDAWSDYAETFEAKKQKLAKAIEADLEKLGADYRLISELQRDAFEQRSFLAEIGNVDGNGAKRKRFPLRLYQEPKINLYNGDFLLGVALADHDQERDLIISGFSLLEG